MIAGREEPDVDLVWLDALTNDLDALANRLEQLAGEARAARARGIDRSGRFKRMSTATLVAEWLSYGAEEEPPEILLAELWRRAHSHERDSGPGVALLWRALDHQQRRVTPLEPRRKAGRAARAR